MEHIVSSPKWFVLNFVPCPSCNERLEPRPTESEWNNVFCTFCDFACRFVVAPHSPNNNLLAVRKADLEDLLDRRKSLPPLMIHFKWEVDGMQREQVEFAPFIAYRFLKEQGTEPISLTPDNAPDAIIFSNMFELPHVTLYSSPSDEEIADEIARTWSQPIQTSRIQEKFRIGYSHSAKIKDLVDEHLRKQGKLEDDEEELF